MIASVAGRSQCKWLILIDRHKIPELVQVSKGDRIWKETTLRNSQASIQTPDLASSVLCSERRNFSFRCWNLTAGEKDINGELPQVDFGHPK